MENRLKVSMGALAVLVLLTPLFVFGAGTVSNYTFEDLTENVIVHTKNWSADAASVAWYGYKNGLYASPKEGVQLYYNNMLSSLYTNVPIAVDDKKIHDIYLGNDGIYWVQSLPTEDGSSERGFWRLLYTENDEELLFTEEDAIDWIVVTKTGNFILYKTMHTSETRIYDVRNGEHVADLGEYHLPAPFDFYALQLYGDTMYRFDGPTETIHYRDLSTGEEGTRSYQGVFPPFESDFPRADFSQSEGGRYGIMEFVEGSEFLTTESILLYRFDAKKVRVENTDVRILRDSDYMIKSPHVLWENNGEYWYYNARTKHKCAVDGLTVGSIPKNDRLRQLSGGILYWIDEVAHTMKHQKLSCKKSSANSSVANYSLVKSPNSSAVYYIGDDRKRHAFPTEGVFKSWFGNFDSVQTISTAKLASFQLGENVKYRPGQRMVKLQSDPKVYAVDRNGTLRWVTDATVARDMYGVSWSVTIDDISDSMFVDYEVGEPLYSGDEDWKFFVESLSPYINIDMGM